MSDVSIGGALGEGFGLIRRKPLTVLTWGGVQLLLGVLTWTLYGPLYFSFLGRAVAAGPRPSAPDPALMAQALQMQGLGLLSGLLSMAVSVILYCAVFRAVVRPEESRFAYMRVGAAELLLGALAIGAYFAFLIGLVILMIPAVIIIGVLAGTHNPAAAFFVGVVMALLVMAAIVYVGLRFSLVGPMMVRDNRFHLMESWTLTRGRVVSLLGLALALFAVFIGVYIVIGLIVVAVGAAGVAVLMGGFSGLPQLFAQNPGAAMSRLSPVLVLLAIIWTPISGGVIAIGGAPWAKVFRDLDQSDVQETFA